MLQFLSLPAHPGCFSVHGFEPCGLHFLQRMHMHSQVLCVQGWLSVGDFLQFAWNISMASSVMAVLKPSGGMPGTAGIFGGGGGWTCTTDKLGAGAGTVASDGAVVFGGGGGWLLAICNVCDVLENPTSYTLGFSKAFWAHVSSVGKEKTCIREGFYTPFRQWRMYFFIYARFMYAWSDDALFKYYMYACSDDALFMYACSDDALFPWCMLGQITICFMQNVFPWCITVFFMLSNNFHKTQILGA